jgi:hypothetical protein
VRFGRDHRTASDLHELKPPDEYLLPPDSGEVVLQAGFRAGAVGGGVTLRPVALGEAFTFEAVLRPSDEQPPWATVAGNHPGHRDFQGFALQKAGTAGGCDWTAALGDGSAWRRVGEPFRLEPGRWHHLALVVGGGAARVYVDGEVVASGEGVAFCDSDTPLWVGNSVGRNRPFAGLIEEVRLLRHALPVEAVRANAEQVLSRRQERPACDGRGERPGR